MGGGGRGVNVVVNRYEMTYFSDFVEAMRVFDALIIRGGGVYLV